MSLQEAISEVKSYLYPWQIEFLACKKDRMAVAKCRQIGLSTALALDALIHSSIHPEHNSYILSKTVSQARDDVMEYARSLWLPALSTASDFFSEAEILRNEIRLPNGSKIKAEAASPEKIRGKRGSFYCDEASFYPKRYTEGLDQAINPIIDNNINSKWRVVSTKWLKDSWFGNLWTNESNLYPNWERKQWDIHDCIQHDGFTFDIERKRREKTEQEWRTEYLCKFLKLSDNFFQKGQIQPLYTDQNFDLEDCDRYIGIDIGRESDRTSIVSLRSVGENDLVVVDKIRQMKQERFAKQEEIITKLLDKWDWEKCLLDKTAHPALSESLEEKFNSLHGLQGERERKVSRTNELKSLVEKENILFHDNNKIWQGRSWRECNISIEDDLSKVSQEITAAENVTFSVERDDEGHGDAYSALLLALHCVYHQSATYLGSF